LGSWKQTLTNTTSALAFIFAACTLRRSIPASSPTFYVWRAFIIYESFRPVLRRLTSGGLVELASLNRITTLIDRNHYCCSYFSSNHHDSIHPKLPPGNKVRPLPPTFIFAAKIHFSKFSDVLRLEGIHLLRISPVLRRLTNYPSQRSRCEECFPGPYLLHGCFDSVFLVVQGRRCSLVRIVLLGTNILCWSAFNACRSTFSPIIWVLRYPGSPSWANTILCANVDYSLMITTCRRRSWSNIN